MARGALKSGFSVQPSCGKNSLELESPITKRTVWFNKSQKGLIFLPGLDVAQVVVAIDDLIENWRQRQRDENLSLESKFLRDVECFTSCTRQDELAETLQRVIERAAAYEIFSSRPRIGDLLITLWSSGALMLPEEYLYTKFVDSTLRPVVWSALGRSIAPVIQAFSGISQYLWGTVLKCLTRVGGMIEFGDFPPEAMRLQTLEVNYKDASKFRSAAIRIRRFHLQMYGAAAAKLPPTDYAFIKDRVIRLDKTFEWCVERDPSLTDWKEQAATFIQGEGRGHAGKVTALNAFLDFLIDHPDMARDPTALVRGGAINADFPTWLREKRGLSERSENFSRYINVVHQLAEAVIARHWVVDGVRAPGVRNPFNRQQRKRITRVRTNRRALPSFITRRMREIIVADDFAWPKTLKADYFQYVSEGGEVLNIWSPVRATALWIKLHLPLRGFQIRMLNSGEADAVQYDKITGAWFGNRHVLAGTAPTPMGVIRRFHDEFSRTDFAGFYVNTNKTQDTDLASGRGYEIPWHYKDVVDRLCQLREFQEAYNPVWSAVLWEELHERYIRVTFSPQQLTERGGETFLFRDPCSPHPNEPVGADRLDGFYAQLCLRTEQVLAEEGVTLPDGSPIQLVRMQTPNASSRTLFPEPIYDMHSLRVALLTSMATEGKVPLAILSQCVAGHATLLMTLYYQSFSVSYVNEVLSESQMHIMEDEQSNLLRWMREQSSTELLRERAVALSGDAFETFLKGDPASWIVMDSGICPTGCTRCSDGGSPIQISKGEYRRYGPVPTAPNGSPRNCPRCRFFITGPCFLVGLQAQFNATSLSLQCHAEDLRKKQESLAKLDQLRHQAQIAGGVFNQHRTHQAAVEAVENARDTLDQTALTLHAIYGLAAQAAQLLRSIPQSADGKYELIINGDPADIEMVLESTTDFELVDSICHSADWFASVVPEVANLKRARILDRMLSRNGVAPVFSFLDEGDALRVGNELTKFLHARVGRTSTLRILDGEVLLESFGIVADVQDMLPRGPLSTPAQQLKLTRNA